MKRPPMPAYAELAVTTNFSFLRGASHPEELVAQAQALGMAGIGVADRNSVAGVVRAHIKARECGLRFAPGARLVFADGTPDILAYPQDRAGWGRLTQLLTVGKTRAEKGGCILYSDDLLEYATGLNLIVLPPFSFHLQAEENERPGALLARLSEAAHRSLFLAACMLHRGDDRRRLARLAAAAGQAGVPLLAVNDVLYHVPERRPLQDVVTCIRERITVDAAGRMLHANAERHLKAPREMARLFRSVPEAVDASARFLDRCRFSLDELRHEYPHETRAGFAAPQDALRAFAEEGFAARYPRGARADVRRALERELELIGALNYAPYFLTVHDIVRFARSRGILCQGRGSAANSVICYCLGITEVDPERVDLLFERFVSAERGEPPDIDVDFEHERREEVIQYIYRTYSRERAGLAAAVICYRGRSAVREVGKAFGLSEDAVGKLAGTLWGWSMDGVASEEVRQAGFDPADRRLQQVIALSRELMGFPRHLSQHVGGFVITRSRLDEVVPIENAAMPERTVIEWDKDDLNDLGILKVDVLGLGMLSCLRRAFDLLRAHYAGAVFGRDAVSSREGTVPFSIAGIPVEDPAVYRMLQRADSVGVFQVESRAQMSMLPRLKPKEFYDLVIEVAIVRPGPIQGDMVHPYLRRRQGLEPVSYPSRELEDILKKTLGVPLFQEHAMRIAIVAAGFAPAESDRLRRAMATFRRVGTINTFRQKFIDGMLARDYTREFAERCFGQIEGFGEYGFPESHAASFALLVYASAWVKCHYPDVFAAALLNSQPMGFYAPAQIVRDAQEHGVAVQPVDVNFSDWDCSLEADEADPGKRVSSSACGSVAACADRIHPRHEQMKDDIRTAYALRLGLRQIGGLSQDDAQTIERVRGAGFDSVRDLWLRTRLAPAVLERLAEADAFGSLGLGRRAALWAVKALRRSGDKDDLPLFARAAMSEREPDSALPPMPPGQEVIEDYRSLRLSLKAHPVSFLRDELDARRILRTAVLAGMKTGLRTTVAGLVLVRQRPGTSGVIFMTLEDETGIANAIVWPRVFEAFRPQILGGRLVGVTGAVQNECGVIHIVAERIRDLTPLLSRLCRQGTAIEPTAHADTLLAMLHSGELDDAGNGSAPGDGNAAAMPKGRNFH